MAIESFGSLNDVSGRLIDRLVGASGSVFQGTKVIPAFNPGGTSATIVPALGTGASGAAFLTDRSSDSVSGLYSYASGLDGLPFKLKLSGRVATTAAATVTLSIGAYPSPTLTYASGNIIAHVFTSSGLSINGKANFYFETRLLWDSTTQDLGGVYEGWYDYAGTLSAVAPTAITNHQAITSASALNFQLALTSSVAGKTTLYVSEFRAEMI